MREDMTVTDKTPQQHETDARLLREKIARLRELRLARDGGNSTGGSASAGKQSAVGSKPRKAQGRTKAVPLSQWLSTQDKEGRRN